MTLKDLMRFIAGDKVCVYIETESSDFETEFEDLYYGRAEKMPKELQERTVRTVGAKRKGVLDIRVD